MWVMCAFPCNLPPMKETTPETDLMYMRQAIREAMKAYDMDEVPVGAVVVANDQIIARGHNLTERLHDVTAHAEMQAITAASNALGAKYLPDCTLYVTLEPCSMCAGALFWSQIGRIVYGASDAKREKIEQLAMLLAGALAAEGKVLLKLNVQTDRVSDVIAILPSLHAPTINTLNDQGWTAVESVVDESMVREIIPRLKKVGAEGIIELPLNKVIV